MKKIMLFSPLLVLLCSTSLMSAPSTSSVAKGGARKDRSNLPITINSNQLAADNKGKKAIFTGKVVARQGDVTILADKLTVYYGDKKNDLEKVEADGNVRILQGNRVGIASHAVYESKAGKIVLTGKPRVMQGNDTTSGKIITYLIDDEQSIVTGDVGERVVTTIHPQDGKAHESSR